MESIIREVVVTGLSMILGLFLIYKSLDRLLKIYLKIYSEDGKDTESRFLALKTVFKISYVFAVGGVIMIILGIIFLMKIIPWWQ